MKDLLLQLKYFTLMSLKQRDFVFWMLAFPMLLCSVYWLGFSRLDNPEAIHIKLGMTENLGVERILGTVPVFELVKGEQKELEEKLGNKEIDAFLDENFELIVPEFNEKTKLAASILEEVKKYSTAFIIGINKEYELGLQDAKIVKYSLKELSDFMAQNTSSILPSMREFSVKVQNRLDDQTAENSVLKIVLFTSLAMFSLNGIYIGVNYITIIQGYLSPLGIRIAASPYKKGNLIIVAFLTSLALNLLFNLILYLFIRFVLGISLLSNYSLSCLVYFVASCFGSALGILFGTTRKLNDIQKTNITTAVLLTLSFLCGLAGDLSFKNLIEKNLPILNRINFVNLINESFYQANIIGDLSKLYRNMGILAVETVVLLVLAVLLLRRNSYDSL
ncbi:MAG: hypothetical protein Q4A72_07720 [Bacillota bacterium]|nr:hypothetical protein [Bacillota bacterium]